jgi:hypothetical protein
MTKVVKYKRLVESKPNYWKNRIQLNVTALSSSYKIVPRNKSGDLEVIRVKTLDAVYEYAQSLRTNKPKLIVGISIH